MSRSLKGPVVVAGRSLHQVHFGPRDAAYGPVPVVSYAYVEVSGVEVLKVLVEGHKTLHVDGERERESDVRGSREADVIRCCFGPVTRLSLADKAGRKENEDIREFNFRNFLFLLRESTRGISSSP